MEIRAYDTAQHEAAHVVVGVALGLRLHSAVLGHGTAAGYDLQGYAWFYGTRRGGRFREAFALMYGAGVAWDSMLKRGPRASSLDAQYCRELCSGRHGYETMVRASAALLAGLHDAHARVTRALLERDITGADLLTIARGDAIE